jgi:hypothetical protein
MHSAMVRLRRTRLFLAIAVSFNLAMSATFIRFLDVKRSLAGTEAWRGPELAVVPTVGFLQLWFALSPHSAGRHSAAVAPSAPDTRPLTAILIASDTASAHAVHSTRGSSVATLASAPRSSDSAAAAATPAPHTPVS